MKIRTGSLMITSRILMNHVNPEGGGGREGCDRPVYLLAANQPGAKSEKKVYDAIFLTWTSGDFQGGVVCVRGV